MKCVNGLTVTNKWHNKTIPDIFLNDQQTCQGLWGGQYGMRQHISRKKTFQRMNILSEESTAEPNFPRGYGIHLNTEKELDS